MYYLLGFVVDSSRRRGSHLEQKEKLGLTSAPRGRSNTPNPPAEPTDAFQKVEACISFHYLSNSYWFLKTA
jgi:hypothetical protein